MTERQSARRKACIIVLGDIGRSPRMQYHAQSLIEANYSVEIISYLETKPSEALIKSHIPVKLHGLSPFPDMNLPTSLKYFFKTIWQTLTLLIALMSIARPNFILVQNPPAVPTFMVCWLYCIFTRTKYIIDWHNYTHSILALNTINPKNMIVRLAKWIEYRVGVKASGHFCVTKAMQNDLKNNWGIIATVLYDRAPTIFQPITLEKKHELFMKLSKVYENILPKQSDPLDSGVVESTIFTQKLSDGRVVYKKKRPAILVSSTSWTPDEDFGMLLEALKEYEEVTKYSNTYPELLCIITGKGPQKEEYVEKMSKMKWKKVSIITPWLEETDYPKVLASADLGVCLHYSSSGLDLPMKIVDMFGCGLPVCAINFECLHELVINGQNGFTFETANELAEQIQMWFETFPNNLSLSNTKEIFTKNLKQFQSLRWKENWNLNALPVLNAYA